MVSRHSDFIHVSTEKPSVEDNLSLKDALSPIAPPLGSLQQSNIQPTTYECAKEHIHYRIERVACIKSGMNPP